MEERLREHDVDLVLVSLAKVKDAAAWRRVTGYQGELYLDDTTDGDPRKGVAAPASQGYAAFKLNRGPGFVMNDKNKAHAALVTRALTMALVGRSLRRCPLSMRRSGMPST